MLWCSRCKYEYDEGIGVCFDCGETLVEAPSKPINETESPKYANQKLLVTVNSRFEADNLAACLQTENIPVMRRQIGAGTHLTLLFGDSYTGTEIYVQEHLFFRAAEVVGRFLVPDCYCDCNCDCSCEDVTDSLTSEKDSDKSQPSKNIFSRIFRMAPYYIRWMFIVYLATLLAGVVCGVVNLVELLFF